MNLYDLVSTPDGYTEVQRQIASLTFSSIEDMTHRKFKSEEIYPLFTEIFNDVNERTINCLCDILDIDLYDSLDIN